MKILVTGGAGFVGSHIVDRVIEKGHTPIVVDDLSSGVNYVRDDVKFHRATVGFEMGPLDLLECDAVIHAAAYAELRHNWTRDGERVRLLESNVHATIDLLERTGSVPFVFLSTASVYGSSTKDAPVTELDAVPETIESPYAASKLACEAYVAAYSQARGFRYHIARLVNVVGDRTHRGVIRDFVQRARTEGHIHAADNGKQRKSWVHVKDVAEAVVDLALDETIPCGAYNISSAERISWWDIVDHMKWPLDKVTYEDRSGGAIGDPVDLHVDSSKLAPWFTCSRPVSDGIRDALTFLGWPC